MADTGSSLVAGPSGLRIWLVVFAGLVALGTLWSLASPVGAPPDETVHLARAAALMRGQLVGSPYHHQVSASTTVRIPASYASDISRGACYAFRPTVPAGCARALSASDHSVRAVVYVGRYPPLYYALVGWPTAFTSDPVLATYLARLVSIIVDAAFLAAAGALALRARAPRLLAGGVVVATTPMVLYLAAIFNPNSLEVCAAVCLWVAVILLLLEAAAGAVSKSVVCITAAAASTVALARPDSVLWLPLIALAICPLAWQSGIGWRRLARKSSIRVGAATVVVCAVMVVTWTSVEHGLEVGNGQALPRAASFPVLVRGALGQASDWLVQDIGKLGYLDATVPEITLLAWIGLLALLILGGFLVGSRRVRTAIVVTCLVTVVPPLALVLAAAHRHGYIGLGRYFLALAVGIPIVSAMGFAAGNPLAQRINRLVLALACVGQVFAYWWVLHRYTVGARGPFSPFSKVVRGWTPPVPVVALDVAFAVLCVALAAAAARWLGRRSDGPDRADRRDWSVGWRPTPATDRDRLGHT